MIVVESQGQASTMTPSLMTGTCMGAATEAFPRQVLLHRISKLHWASAVHVMPKPGHGSTSVYLSVRTLHKYPNSPSQRQVVRGWSKRKRKATYGVNELYGQSCTFLELLLRRAVACSSVAVTADTSVRYFRSILPFPRTPFKLIGAVGSYMPM